MQSFSSITEIDAHLAAIRAAKAADLKPNPLVTDKFRWNDPHRVGVTHLVLKPRFLLRDPTGCGKTPQAIVAYAYLRLSLPEMRILVATRRAAGLQWGAQFLRFTTLEPPLIAGWYLSPDGREFHKLTPAERYDQYQAWLRPDGPKILIGTYHTLAKDLTLAVNPTTRRLAVPVAQIAPYVLVCDEIQDCRGREGSLLYPAFKGLADSARYVWGLSATTIMHDLDDLYTAIEIVRPGTFGTYQQFADRYLHRKLMKLKNGRRFWKVFGPKREALPFVEKLLEPFTLCRPKAEFGQAVPEIVCDLRLLEFSDKQRLFYRQTLLQYWPKLKDRKKLADAGPLPPQETTASATAAAIAQADPDAPKSLLTALAYAQMAADMPEVLGYPSVKSVKFEALLDILTKEYPEDKVLVFTRFAQVASLLASHLRALKIPVGVISGQESAGSIRKTQVAFAEDPAHRCVVLTTAGGTALDGLQVARVLVFYDLPWSWGEFAQVIGRAHREGSPHPSLAVVLLGVQQTIDQHTLNLLNEQETVIAATFTSTDQILKHAAVQTDTTTVPVHSIQTTSSVNADTTFVKRLFALTAPTLTERGEALSDDSARLTVEPQDTFALLRKADRVSRKEQNDVTLNVSENC